MTELAKNKVALITGASRGIGAATAREFVRQGARVILAARSRAEIDRLAEELNADEQKAIAQTVDVTNYEDLFAAVDKGLATFGRLDILINNAGTIEPISHLASSDPGQWAQAADINYKGVYFGMRAVLPHFIDTGGGTIINVSSGAAHGPMEGWSHYCGAKAGAHMLMRCAHLEAHAKGVRVFGLSPGTVATDMQVKIKASGVNPVSKLDPNVHIDPIWPAKALVWMSTREADDYCGEEISLKDPELRKSIGLQ